MLELVLLALLALPALVSRRVDRYHLVHLLVWLHLGLTSMRNVPLFAFAAAPALATLVDGLPMSFRSWLDRAAAPVALDPCAGGTCFCSLVVSGVTLGGFDAGKVAALGARHAQPAAAGRASLQRAGLGRPDRRRDASGPAQLRGRPVRALRQGGDPRVRRGPRRRPGLGQRPRPRPHRPGLGQARPRPGQAESLKEPGLDGALPRFNLGTLWPAVTRPTSCPIHQCIISLHQNSKRGSATCSVNYLVQRHFGQLSIIDLKRWSLTDFDDRRIDRPRRRFRSSFLLELLARP